MLDDEMLRKKLSICHFKNPDVNRLGYKFPDSAVSLMKTKTAILAVDTLDVTNVTFSLII